MGVKYFTFVSNWGGNLRVLRSFSSLSEKRRSWSADVPLKKPKKGMNKRERAEREGQTGVSHGGSLS